MNLPSLLRLAACAGLLAALPACQTAPTARDTRLFPEPGADWITSVGQLRYLNPQRSVIGEAIVSRHGGSDFALDFLTGPGVPLIRVRESGNAARAEGIFARGSWRGRANRAGRLAPWMTLREAFAALEAQKGPRPQAASPVGAPLAWQAKGDREGRALRRVEVEYPGRSERFVFVFAR